MQLTVFELTRLPRIQLIERAIPVTPEYSTARKSLGRLTREQLTSLILEAERR